MGRGTKFFLWLQIRRLNVMSLLAFIRCVISTPSPSSVPLSSVCPVLRPSFSSPSIFASVASPVTPVLLSRFLLPVCLGPLPLPLLFPLPVLLPLLLPVPLSFPFAVSNLQRLPTGAGLCPALSGVLYVPAVSVVARVSGRFPSSITSVPSLTSLSGLPVVASVPR